MYNYNLYYKLKHTNHKNNKKKKLFSLLNTFKPQNFRKSFCPRICISNLTRIKKFPFLELKSQIIYYFYFPLMTPLTFKFFSENLFRFYIIKVTPLQKLLQILYNTYCNFNMFLLFHTFNLRTHKNALLEYLFLIKTAMPNFKFLLSTSSKKSHFKKYFCIFTVIVPILYEINFKLSKRDAHHFLN